MISLAKDDVCSNVSSCRIPLNDPNGGFVNQISMMPQAMLALALALSGCSAVTHIKEEMAGTSKPEGGIAELIPPSKMYTAEPQALRRAVLAVLEEQGYIAEELANGAFRTEPKPLGDSSRFAFAGATYSVKASVRIEGTAVTFRARFDKKSNITQPELNVDYPEKENELRKAFFAGLDKRLIR